MNRFTKTTMVALAIVAGTTAGAFAQKKWIRPDPVTKDLYRFTYLNDGTCYVKVEVIDAHEEKLLSEQIIQKKSFTKPYIFTDLDFGEYSFNVTAADGEYVTKIKRSNDVYMVANIKKVDEDKAKVIVKGEFMSQVSLNIFDKNNVLIFDDYIDRERAFSKIYDLSKVKANELRVEVVTEMKLLATAAF